MTTPRTPVDRLRRATARVAVAATVAAGAFGWLAATAPAAEAQQVVSAYIPPDELVSFPSATPMDDFIRLVNPVFRRVTGKSVVDPEDREGAIGVSLNGVHFIDAFELVLDRQNLDFRETDGYFIIEEPQPVIDVNLVAATTDQQSVAQIDAGPRVVGGGTAAEVSAREREVRISAIIFELNRSKAREVGTNWGALFGEASGEGSGSGTGTGSGQEEDDRPQFFLNASSFIDALDGFIETSTDRLEIGLLLNVFRWFEDQGYGQTLASPSVTVRSGEQGRMQSGEDIPINVRDFQGNTITQYISTGTIIDVTPTLIQEDIDGDMVEFVAMDVKVEKSNARPQGDQLAVAKNDVTTQVMLLDGEQTVIGGLISTNESQSRRGVPILMDVPVLSYLFSYKTTQRTQNELIVVLQADVVEDLRTRSANAYDGRQLEEARQRFRDRMNRFNSGAGDRYDQLDVEGTIEIQEDAERR